MERATIYVRGRVQGVGFRWWVRARALELDLVGFARNMADGRVEVCAQGPRDVVERLEGLIREEPTSSGRPGHVQRSVTKWRESLDELEGFTQR